MNRWHLRSKILIQLVALDFALLQIQGDVETNACQGAETVQLTLLDRQAVPDLDVPEIGPGLQLVRLAGRTDRQILLVDRAARLRLIPLRIKRFLPFRSLLFSRSSVTAYLVRVMLPPGSSGRSRWRQSLIRSGRRRGTHSALRRIRPLAASRARVLLLQRSRHVESHVALIPRRRAFPARRPVLLSTPRLILVVRVLAFVYQAKTVGLLDERFLVVVREQPTSKREEAEGSVEMPSR